jgi:peptidyl-prolyl cis-trans isomerase-like protein 2
VTAFYSFEKEELMFEDISKPLKGKAKEKDVGKRRAYVRVVTSLGGASLNLELYCEKVRIFKTSLKAN